MTAVSRTAVLQAIGSYFGGSWNATDWSYQNGPLTSVGLGSVKLGFPKQMPDKDYVIGLPEGRNMGAIMIVTLPDDQETRAGDSGPPVTDGGGNLIAGGTKFDNYRVALEIYHMGETQHSEQSQADVDTLLEAIKQRIRIDRTLGTSSPSPPLITQAGEGRYGIQTSKGRPGIGPNGSRTYTWSTIRFEVMTQFTA